MEWFKKLCRETYPNENYRLSFHNTRTKSVPWICNCFWACKFVAERSSGLRRKTVIGLGFEWVSALDQTWIQVETPSQPHAPLFIWLGLQLLIWRAVGSCVRSRDTSTVIDTDWTNFAKVHSGWPIFPMSCAKISSVVPPVSNEIMNQQHSLVCSFCRPTFYSSKTGEYSRTTTRSLRLWACEINLGHSRFIKHNHHETVTSPFVGSKRYCRRNCLVFTRRINSCWCYSNTLQNWRSIVPRCGLSKVIYFFGLFNARY
jgi:hypothetical protein